MVFLVQLQTAPRVRECVRACVRREATGRKTLNAERPRACVRACVRACARHACHPTSQYQTNNFVCVLIVPKSNYWCTCVHISFWGGVEEAAWPRALAPGQGGSETPPQKLICTHLCVCVCVCVCVCLCVGVCVCVYG